MSALRAARVSDDAAESIARLLPADIGEAQRQVELQREREEVVDLVTLEGEVVELEALQLEEQERRRGLERLRLLDAAARPALLAEVVVDGFRAALRLERVGEGREALHVHADAVVLLLSRQHDAAIRADYRHVHRRHELVVNQRRVIRVLQHRLHAVEEAVQVLVRVLLHAQTQMLPGGLRVLANPVRRIEGRGGTPRDALEEGLEREENGGVGCHVGRPCPRGVQNGGGEGRDVEELLHDAVEIAGGSQVVNAAEARGGGGRVERVIQLGGGVEEGKLQLTRRAKRHRLDGLLEVGKRTSNERPQSILLNP